MSDSYNHFESLILIFIILTGIFCVVGMVNNYTNERESIKVEILTEHSDAIERIEKLETHNHIFSEWTVVREASENDEGIMIRKCKCGAMQSRNTPKIEVSNSKENIYKEFEPAKNDFRIILCFGFCIIVATPALLFLLLMAVSNKLASKGITKKELNDIIKTKIDSAKEVFIPKTPFEEFQKELSENIAILRKMSCQTNNLDLNFSIRKSLKYLEDIYKNTDSKEFDKGNIKRLNGIYLENYKNLLNQFENLNKYIDSNNPDVFKALNKLKKAIIDFEDIFKEIFEESISNDLLRADIDSKVILDVARSNGLLQKNSLIF